MSWLEAPDGSRLEIFGAGGGATVAANLTRATGTDVPLLGQVPIDVRLREAGDAGTPVVLADPDSPARRRPARRRPRPRRPLPGARRPPLGLSPVGTAR